MKRYIFKRIGQSLICLLGVTCIVFSLTRITGDPTMLLAPPEATKEDIALIKQTLGLDRPIYIQYWTFMKGLAIGDFGKSIRWNTSTLKLFGERFPNTLLLAVAAMSFAVLIGIPVGILSSVYVGKWFDNFGKVLALLGQAIPVFWLGIMLIMVFAVFFGLLPTSGIGTWKHLIMPAITLGWYFTAALTRLTRSTMLDVLDADYIRMARIVGVSQLEVICKHAFKNAVLPILTLGTVNFIILLNGTVITEAVFDWPGVGRLVVDAIFTRDYPVVQTCVLIASSFFIFANLFVDIIYAYLDPRIRYH